MTVSEPDGTVWHTSSYCGGRTDCVQVASSPERVQVRDSKDPEGPALSVPTPAWQRFLSALTH
jgi:hypothetical protein